jgi:hypothetical protein
VRPINTQPDCLTNWISPATKRTVTGRSGCRLAPALLIRWSISATRKITIDKSDGLNGAQKHRSSFGRHDGACPRCAAGDVSPAPIGLVNSGAQSLPKELDPTSSGPL